MKTPPPRLVVHALPGDHGQALATALADMARGSGTGPVSLDDATQQLSQSSKHQLCILYVDPVRVICAAMTDGGDVTETVRIWTDAARAALTLHRHNRRRSMIFEASHLQRYAALALDRLQIETNSQSLGKITETTATPTPLQYILARSLLDEMADAKAAAEELDASAQILSNEEHLDSAALALEAYEELQDKINDAAELPTLQTEIAKAQAQIRDKTAALETLQSQLDTKTADITALSQKLAKGQAELDAQKATAQQEIGTQSAQITKLEAQKLDMGAEMETLEAQLAILTDQTKRDSKAHEQVMLEMASQRDAHTAILKTTTTKLTETTSALEAREAALSEAQAYIEHIMNSRSMRLTRPLRAAFSFLRGSR